MVARGAAQRWRRNLRREVGARTLVWDLGIGRFLAALGMTIFRRGATLPVRQTYTVFLGDFGECVAQTAHDSLLAEYDHGIEQRRGNGLADDGHANRVDEQSGFDAGGFGDGA